MPLHHQFKGSAEAQALAHEISAKCPNYDSDTLDEKWSSFQSDAPNARTIRSITWTASEETSWTPPPGIDLVGSQVTADEFPNLRDTEEREFTALTATDMDATRIPTNIKHAVPWFAKQFFVLSEGNKPMVGHWWCDKETGREILRT